LRRRRHQNASGIVYGTDLAFTTLPGNDHCAEALTVSYISTNTQSTAGMTTGGDVIPSNLCPIGGNDVWFKTTTPESGILTVDTAGSSFDTILGIYSGACGSLSPLACNDDVGNGLRWSSTQVAVSSGNTYYFVVSGFLGATGTLNLRLSFIPYSRPLASGVTISNLGPRTVTLHADVDPGFLPTTSWWGFGTNGFALDALPAVLNQSGQPYHVATPITGLLPNTTYFYFFNATNSYGRFERLRSFTTPADGSLVEATVPGDVIAASSANSPGAQTAPRAIDNDITSKYLNFDKLRAGFTVTPSGNKPVRALSLISAEDEPARDPSSVIVEGSDDGVNFIRIASNAVPAFATRHGIQSIPLPGTNEFNVYRVSFPTVSNAAAANSMQIAEAELLHYPEITSPNDALSITFFGAGMDVRGVQSLFDRQLDDIHKLEVFFFTGTGAARVDLTPAAGPTVLKGFELIGAADDLAYPQRRPSSVAVYGSNGDGNYTLVASGAPTAPTSNLQIQEFSSETNQVAFRHYVIILGSPVDGGDRLQVGEMRLFGETVPVPPTLSIRASGNSVLVSWQNTPGFILETRSALDNGNWTPVGVAPMLNNGVNTVTLPKQGIGFFRLRK